MHHDWRLVGHGSNVFDKTYGNKELQNFSFFFPSFPGARISCISLSEATSLARATSLTAVYIRLCLTHAHAFYTHTHTKQRRFADRYTQTENTHTHPFSVHTVCACIVCGGGGRKKEIKWFGIGRIDEKGRTP